MTNLKPFYVQNIWDNKHQMLQSLSVRLEAVSVHSVLKRGFAWISDDKFQTIYDAGKAKKAQNLHIRFADGIIKVRVTERHNAVQGDLFDDF